MDETQGPGHLLAPGLLNDYCQIFHWQLITASIEAVSKLKVGTGLSHHRLEVLIAPQISQLKGLDISPKKVYSCPNSHIVQSSALLSIQP